MLGTKVASPKNGVPVVYRQKRYRRDEDRHNTSAHFTGYVSPNGIRRHVTGPCQCLAAFIIEFIGSAPGLASAMVMGPAALVCAASEMNLGTNEL